MRSPAKVQSKTALACSPEAGRRHVLWPEQTEQLAAIVEHSNDAVFSRNVDGSIATWNRAAERIFGYTAREMIGRSSYILLPRGHRDEFRLLLASIRRGELVQHFETERLRKDGKRIVVSLTLSPVRNERGTLVGFSTIARDITEQRWAQESLKRSERALADLFQEASVGLAWTTAKGRVLDANRALLDILGCGIEECVGHLLAKFHPDRVALADLLRRVTGRETVRNFQSTLRSAHGELREVLIDGSAFWENDRIVHLRWFVRDITSRKRLERQVLAISERERSAFARELHDSLGQQLSGITYLTNVVRDRLREAGSAEADDVGRISRLLKQAIDQTRAVARGLSPVQLDPDGLRSGLKELAAQSSELFRIRCHFHVTKSIAVTNRETATHLYRIAQEAVHNAVRHGGAKRVVITLTCFRKQLKLTILDDGKGIKTLSPRRKGLGLRIMQYRAGLVRGTLNVRAHPRGGTQVCCITPIQMLSSNEGDREHPAAHVRL